MNFKNWLGAIFDGNQNYIDFKNDIDVEKIVRVSGISGSGSTLLISNLFKESEKTFFYLTKSDDDAKNARLDFETYGIDRVYYFPSVGTTPYQSSIMDEDIESQRLETLIQMIKGTPCIICLSSDALFFNVVPKRKLSEYIINISKKSSFEMERLTKKLVESGYYRVERVTLAGEFAVRGDILDVYYSSLKNPVRIEFFGDDVESIRSFNYETQKSEETLDEIIIPPFKEIVYGKEELDIARKRLEGLSKDEEAKERILDKIANFQQFDGEHYYLNLFYDKSSLLDYVDSPLLVVDDRALIDQRLTSFFREFDTNYNETSSIRKIKYQPRDMLFNFKEIYEKTDKIVEIDYFASSDDAKRLNFNFEGIPVYLGNLELFKSDLKKYLDDKYKILLFAVNDIQATRLQGIFNQFAPKDDRFDFQPDGFSIVPLYLSSGFLCKDKKIIFLTDYEIFGKRKKISKHFWTRRTEVIDSFLDLKPGDYVVHIHHGVGQFVGIERVKSTGSEKDYIAILYADSDKIFIPVEQLNFIQKYISGDFSSPKLDKIGAKGWTKTKERVKKSIDELAGELVKVYSYRLHQKGFAFSPDTHWQKEFEAKFPYEETEDQLLAIEEVKRDMESQKPMDRLICGDVGFGKTEVAMRAGFKAVMSGKQVVMLVPTTILAEQHYNNFCERFRDYPIKIEMLSRFRTEEEQKKIIKDLKDGNIDIIIGTHRVLSEDIKLKNPGLLIIDEEHRFGVKHKERIKQFRMSLDCLTMTATPIPRTLHMSLANIRDMSTINTPPKERQPVETYVMEFNEEILKMAGEKELSREGQIFFLYNRIATIYEMKKYLQQIFPKARIVVAHGRMDEDELEDIIHNFTNYNYDILLTTTIIESGIDIPRANTIFIDRADKLGLAQLYQLRGRVGRSNSKAYAYLFHEPNGVLTEDAMKRLRVISEYTELGSGFKIAMKDLEIRGAGNLLGPEQSGDILAVGFQLYCKLLNESVKEISRKENKEIEIEEENEVYLELHYSGYIPDSYISDPKQKIEIYKKISSIVYDDEVVELKNMLTDRFGKIPKEVDTLFCLVEIRILCKKMRITDVIEKSQNIELKFSDSKFIDFAKLMNLINVDKNIYLLGKSPNSIFLKIEEEEALEEKLEYLKKILVSISVIP